MAEYSAVGDKFTSPGFSPTKYVQDLVQNSRNIDSVLEEKQRITNLADETNNLLKKNVYKNYMQFIETAKEISYLESEMYQLSHMLTEQQNVMQSLSKLSVTDSKGSDSGEHANEKKEEDPRKNLSTLLEQVEGCTHLLDVKERYLIRSGEVTELDQDLNASKKIYVVLLTDSLVLADWLPNRRGPVQYRFQTSYELDNLAVVNMKEDRQTKNCFKILMFPHTRLFQCESAVEKRMWMEVIEQAKQTKLAAKMLKRESALLDPKGSFLRDETNPFDEEDGEDMYNNEGEAGIPEWLVELPENLDVCVAERDFEAAVALVLKTREYLHPNAKALEEMKPRIDQRVKNLVDVLTTELHVSPGRSLQGGPRAARRAVGLLMRLGKSSQACELFLKHRSAVLKYTMRQQKMEGATAPYVRRLCELFFSSMMDTGREFSQAFGNSNSCASALVVWCKEQLQAFVKQFSNHVFTTQVPLPVATECILIIRTHCEKLWKIGLDLCFVLEKLLKDDVERIITDSRDKALEAIKLRAAEDRWRPQNLQNKAGIQKLADDMLNLGVTNINDYTYDDVWVSLTSNTIAFCKTFLNLLDDLYKLYTPTTRTLISDSIIVTFKAQLRHVDASLANKNFRSSVTLIQKNASFLLDVLLPISEQRCNVKISQPLTFWTELRQEFASCAGEKPSARGISKYSATAYL
ncbi:exocyst complex component 8-like [Ornithodoros turicata]|uniref:exocyst complex component 8-like n=1 Tax=Ornithodoros turicata TaxID=34597 RepID=UPI003138DB69